MLNQIVADSIVLYDLYKQYRHLAAAEQFRRLRVRLDERSLEQLDLIDRLVDTVERLGGIAGTDPRQVAVATPWRLLQVHRIIIAKIRSAAVRLPSLPAEALFPRTLRLRVV